MKTRSSLWFSELLCLLVVWRLILGCFCTLTGCKQLTDSQREPILVFGLDNRVYNAPKGLRFDIERTREMLEQAIEKSQKLELVEERSPRVYRAELIISEASERELEKTQQGVENGMLRTVQVELVLSNWPDESQPSKLISVGRFSQVQPENSTDRQEGFDKVLERAIQQAVEYIELQLLTRDLSFKEIENLLSEGKSEKRLYVLRALRDRQDAGALVPRVIDMLSDSDQNIAMESVGVLVAQKDPRAVRPLIRMSRRRDQIFLLQIITALSEIQGAEARGYLFTLAAGHTSSVIRKRADEALKRLLRGQEQSIQTSAAPIADPRQLQSRGWELP